MAVSTEAAVLQSVLTANPGRNNRSENMKYGACSNDLHENKVLHTAGSTVERIEQLKTSLLMFSVCYNPFSQGEIRCLQQ